MVCLLQSKSETWARVLNNQIHDEFPDKCPFMTQEKVGDKMRSLEAKHRQEAQKVSSSRKQAAQTGHLLPRKTQLHTRVTGICGTSFNRSSKAATQIS